MTGNSHSTAILQPRNNTGYGREDVPSARDGQIRDLILDLTRNVTFEQVARLLPPDADTTLSAFAERAASIAVRRRDEGELRAGLLAAALALSLSDDPREALPALALLYRAATMIGCDPDQEFAAVNDLTGDRAPDLVDFTRRAPEDQTVEAMGFHEGADTNGFRFVCDW
jgi:hypothetical protein